MSETVVDARETPGAVETSPTAWRGLLRDDLDRAIVRGGGRWSRALVTVAWIHLGIFLTCQAIYDHAIPCDFRLLYLWGIELGAVILTMRTIVGPRWFAYSPALGVVTRFWGTFLLLSLNLVILNALTGWQYRWHRPAWGTLSTFFFAAMGWLFTTRFFIPAVQMYFTALLMLMFKEFDNLIYGVSWWIALMGIARTIRRREQGEDEAVRLPGNGEPVDQDAMIPVA